MDAAEYKYVVLGRILVEVLEPYRGIRVFLDRIEFMNPAPSQKTLTP
jgi:hypothetical protein